jgi:hypothetical protein
MTVQVRTAVGNTPRTISEARSARRQAMEVAEVATIRDKDPVAIGRILPALRSISASKRSFQMKPDIVTSHMLRKRMNLSSSGRSVDPIPAMEAATPAIAETCHRPEVINILKFNEALLTA